MAAIALYIRASSYGFVSFMANTSLNLLNAHACFGGAQRFYQHRSGEIGLPMKFSVYLPPQALQGAKALGVSLPGTANVAQLMQACAAHGLQDQDHSAVVRALELLAKHEVASVAG